MTLSEFFDILSNFSLADAIDIVIIAYIIYWILKLIKQTRAERLLRGLVILVVSVYASDLLGLRTTYYILSNSMTVGVMALLIVFQPELRRGLERLGRGKFLSRSPFMLNEEDTIKPIDEIAHALEHLSYNKIGALILIEMETGIPELINTGTPVNSDITSALLVSIFFPNTPLHDGATIISGDQIRAAGCFLPLSDNPNLSKQLGTRHLAAIGATEQCDAIALIVSEETGTISMAREGKISRFLDINTVRERLKAVFEKEEQKDTFQHKVQSLLQTWRRKS